MNVVTSAFQHMMTRAALDLTQHALLSLDLDLNADLPSEALRRGVVHCEAWAHLCLLHCLSVLDLEDYPVLLCFSVLVVDFSDRFQ